MGLPLLVVGASGGRLLPKAGAWMNSVKGAFGFMMLGLAVWMLGRILPDAVTMLLWAVLVFMAGVFLGAFQPLDADSEPAAQAREGRWACWPPSTVPRCSIGALAGSRDPLQPLQAFGGPARRRARQPDWPSSASRPWPISTRRSPRPPPPASRLMLDFYADWCTSCIEMERYTFTQPDGARRAGRTRSLLQADVTANDADDQALLRRFGIFGPPTIVFFGPDGRERSGYRVVGFKDAADFAGHVRSAIGS